MPDPDDHGWDGDRCQRSHMVSTVVGGSDFVVNRRLRVIFERFLVDFDRTVEGIAEKGWDGGYACRPVRGRPDARSWHSWGVAIDINASQHPLGSRGTFTDKQVKAIRVLLKRYPGLRWGGDYYSRGDEQHFEWTGTPAAAAALTRKLQAKPAAERTAYTLPKGHWYGQPTDPRAHAGVDATDRPAIARIQKVVGVKADGMYGPKTAVAVKNWQGRRRLRVSGRVGPDVWRRMAL